MLRSRFYILLILSTVAATLGAVPSAAATKQLASPKSPTLVASAPGTLSVSFGPVAGATSYVLFLYPASGQLLRTYSNAQPSGTDISELSACTTYRVAVQAISTSSTSVSSVQSGKSYGRTKCILIPTFASPTATSDGFTVQITNFDVLYSWAGSVSSGSVAIDDAGLATISGLTSDDLVTLTVTTTRVGFEDGSATVTSSRIASPARWIGAGDFTVEFWVKPTIEWATAGRQELFVLLPTSYNARLDITYDNGRWTMYDHESLTSGSVPVSAAMSPPGVGTWAHVALTRQSGVMRLYVAGVKVAESSAVGDFSGLNQLLLGADPNYSWCRCNLSSALIAQVRVVDGSARYTGSTYVVPTTALTRVPGTTFLLNDLPGLSAAGSIELDGTMRYQQIISSSEGLTTRSAFEAFRVSFGSWISTSIVSRTDSPV